MPVMVASFVRVGLLALMICVGLLGFSQNNGLTLYYENNAQIGLFAADGTRILIDVSLPDKLIGPPRSSDLLLTTHDHSDHYKADFIFPGKRFQIRSGQIDWGSARIKSVAKSKRSVKSMLQ